MNQGLANVITTTRRFHLPARTEEAIPCLGIRAPKPHRPAPHESWELFRDGFPGGESFDEIGARADRIVGRVRSIDGAVLLFSSGHFLRVLAARWLGMEPQGARHFLLNTASLSTLTYEHGPSEPAIGLWNDTHHLSGECLEEPSEHREHHCNYDTKPKSGVSGFA